MSYQLDIVQPAQERIQLWVGKEAPPLPPAQRTQAMSAVVHAEDNGAAAAKAASSADAPSVDAPSVNAKVGLSSNPTNDSISGHR